MKNKKFICQIIYKDVVSDIPKVTNKYANSKKALVDYVRLVMDKTSIFYSIDIISNKTGVLLFKCSHKSNDYYIDSSARALASKILRKVKKI